ncbi:MAG: bifunctional 3,4-dihydroxy-2-butanone-4-phosphate synthase/GTP cyclohydrolase II [Candidatus Brocadiae bacterium]|nr:bifunctional 3,4-dihydroxy-2-butanone-4-phosphate synthase/GTP cyclohydrolase II [Candidatus Brocadiia bacterium]
MPLSPIPEILKEIRDGRMIVLVDDENRENEGDLCMAAEAVTPEAINFMARFGRGLVCLALTEDHCRTLDLPMQAEQNSSRFGTAFTVSVDASTGVTTGISAADRARTIQVALRKDARPADLSRPGHIFPLRARPGGVLTRAGQTEGAVDLARLAGLRPAGVICEIMNDDGTMARMPELEQFCRVHNLKLASVEDLIEYRRQNEKLIEKLSVANLPTRFGTFRAHLYRSLTDEYLHIALCAGGVGEAGPDGRVPEQPDPVLVRVHSECLTGDIFGSLRCDCGDQLQSALTQIEAAGRGVLLYIRQEGRGIGLTNKMKAYALQDQGHDTVEANHALGLPTDLRHYGVGCQILNDLGVRRIRLLTNNPKKLVALNGYGLELVERVPIPIAATAESRRYLAAKRDKMGHLIDEPRLP